MHDADVEALVERIVLAARVPNTARRAELRRELRAHFEDAAESPEALGDAIRRFGSEAAVASSLRRVYRKDFALAYAAKIVASLLIAAAAASLIEATVSLRSGGFSHAIVPALFVVVGLIVGRELLRPLLASRELPARRAYLLVFAAFALAEYALHNLRGIDFHLARLLAAAAILVAIWAATLAIAARVDRAFARSFDSV